MRTNSRIDDEEREDAADDAPGPHACRDRARGRPPLEGGRPPPGRAGRETRVRGSSPFVEEGHPSASLPSRHGSLLSMAG